MHSRHRPLGRKGTWKTGQRVPLTGTWKDQYGSITYFEKGATFPPCIDRKGVCAFRELISTVAREAA